MEEQPLKSFKDLIVWQKAADLATLIYSATEQFPSSELYGITNQMRRSVVSVSSNIAEGFKRNHKKEKIQLYNVAYGSLAELESQMEIARKLKFLRDGDYQEILAVIIETSKMLDGLIKSQRRGSSRFYVLYPLCIFTLLYSISYILSPMAVDAVEKIGLGVTRNTFDLEILPGSPFEGQLTVFNEAEDVPVPVHIQLSMWNLKEDSEDYEFVIAEPALNATKWFEFEQGQDFILDPDGSRAVDFRIVTPRDVVPGSYFVMMRFQAVLPEHYFAEGGPRTIPELGVLFFIKVALFTLDGDGEGLYGADILEFEGSDTSPVPLLDRLIGQIVPVAHAGVLEDIVKKFAAKIRNTGLFHFKASGTVEIKNLLDQTVAKAEIPPRFLLPNRNRSFNIQVIEGEESFWKRNSYFGPYTAIMTLNIPESDTPVVIREKFWVLPWKTILLVLFVVAIVLLLRRRIFRAGRALIRQPVALIRKPKAVNPKL